ncbi:hypothetical protein NVP1009O_23 [Vibrio phage 1.009.O._10N.261.51.C9]|nr:hypothetical protein NVP1009O_23 [Vibrio phage 1.009.O._10N.261.51.C9]
MTQAIIYQSDDGGVVVLHPNAASGLTVAQIAAKDVPTGKPYKIVDASTLPDDRTFRDAWEVDAADLTDGVGA